jgi:N-formylmaleamate deformylase
MPSSPVRSLLWTLLILVTLGRPAVAQPAPTTFDVTVTGDGPAIILIPGLMTPGAVWDTTVDRYKDRHTLHVITLAGFGGPSPTGAPFLSRVRDEVIAYIRARDLDRPVIVGHSLGGVLAFWIASTAPDLVSGIVAVDGVPFLPALGNPNATAEEVREPADRIRQLYATFSRQQLVAQTRLALTSMITREADRERALAWVAACDPATAGLATAELMTTDLRNEVSAITVPTLLIGALGAAPPAMHEAFEAAYRAQVSRIEGARVIMAADARHFVMLDDPAFLFAALDEFLRGPVPPTPAAR